MKAILRRISISASRTLGPWVVLLLLLAALVPSACLLWFMNQAVRNERLAVRQRLAEAYRGHLALAQKELESAWNRTAAQTETPLNNPAAFFARQVRAGVADAVVCYDSAGQVIYPDSLRPAREQTPVAGWTDAALLESSDLAAAAAAYARLAAEAQNADLGARALQAQARCLIQSGDKAAALAVLTGPLAQERFRNATDACGGFILPNTEMMALELLRDSSADRARDFRERLTKQLLNYDAPAMPASQRRFLMRELQKLFPQEAGFPLQAAEDLAARYVEANATVPRQPELRASPIPGVWQFASAQGTVLMLHTTENLLVRMQAAASTAELPAGVRLEVVPPGRETGNALLTQAAGPTFPGWQLTLALPDPQYFDTASHERITAYVWTGILAVAVVAALALLALGMVRRQMALTQLRHDLVANVTHELKTPLSSTRLLVDTLLDAPGFHEQTTREYLQLISKENIRLSRLIDNFLTFSRIERNKYAFNFKEVPVASIVETAVGAIRERFNALGCRFDVRIERDLPPMIADADSMVTVLLNLLDNAYKYTGDLKEISFTAGLDDGSVVFRVKDNGRGLSPRDTKRIFKRFYRVNSPDSPGAAGCGLGLSIVRFVVQAHHGTVRVESTPGRGSTFVVSIPASGPRRFPEAEP